LRFGFSGWQDFVRVEGEDREGDGLDALAAREAHGLTMAVGSRLRVDLEAISVQVYQPHFG
jgi:hypothetical protein